MRIISKLWNELEGILKTNQLPERAIYALSDAAMGYQVRSSHYRIVADVSNVVASRDLKALVERGLLVPSGEKRGRLYSGAPTLRETYIKIRGEELQQIPDPFEGDIDLITA